MDINLQENSSIQGKSQKNTPDLKYHLNLSQQIAHIGSWEMDLIANDPDAPQYWSDETYRILGYEPGAITPSFNSFLNSIHPDDRAAVLQAAELTIKEGKPYDLEQRHILPDGRIIITWSLAQVIRDEETGAPLKLCGAMKDITDNKEMFYALEKSNKELNTLFEKIDEVLYSVDMQHYILLQMSAACEKVYGYTVADFKQTPNLWIDVVLEEDKHILWAGDAVMRRGEIVANEYRIRHKDGSIRWLGGTLTPTLDEHGNLLRIDGVSSDITARKEAELAMKESEVKLRALVENSLDGIAITDINQKITFATTSMSAITGYSPEEILSNGLDSLFHPEDLPGLLSIGKEVLVTSGSTMKFTVRFLRKDGKWIWMEGVSKNLFDDPLIQGIITNYRDVTERIEYEEALKASNEHLKKTNGELDRFVYSVSHDLRAPLASILGAIDFTESETDEPEVLQNLAMMKNSAKKLDGFIQDILDYSRNSRMEVEKEEISFTEMLNETINNLKFMSHGNGSVAIRLNVNESQPFHSDRSRLYIVLNNLISNAIRYYDPKAPEPYVAIDVSAGATEALITIKDNGTGIDKKFHDRIFDMFYRVSRKSVGSGLGLYIVKEAVEKLHGTLELESEPGVGTEFKLTIPNLNN